MCWLKCSFWCGWIRPSWQQRKLFWLNEVQINWVQSDAKPPLFHLQRESELFCCMCKTSHTCLLVSGEFQALLFLQAEPVFPDWRMMMMFVIAGVSMLLWQIPFEGDRLILCLKARFCASEWPVCVVSLTVLERLHIWLAYLGISVSYAVPNDQTVSVSPVDIQAQGIDLLCVLFPLEMFAIAGFKMTDFWISPHPQLDLMWYSELVWRSFGLNTDQSWAPMGVLMCAVEAGQILCRETN